MNPEVSKRPAPQELRPGLQHELRGLVEQLQEARRARHQEGIYRQLVQRGLESGLDPRVYRQCLRDAGLAASRASEFACLLENREAAAAFTRAEKPIGFKRALALARGHVQVRSGAAGATALAKLAAQLVGTREHTPWLVDCGLFQLRWLPQGAAVDAVPPDAREGEVANREPNSECLGIPLAPNIEERLARLALGSGLSRAETAAELLRRAPWSELLAAVPSADRAGDEPTGAAPVASGGRPLGETDPPPTPGPVFLLPRRNFETFSLHRRKSPVRTPADVCRLAVKISRALAAQLTALGNRCGRSRPETAALLLEANPVERVRNLHAALAQARQYDRQRFHPPRA